MRVRAPWEFENPICAQIGSDLFFLDDKDERNLDSLSTYDLGRSICNSCEHIRECGEWGIRHESFGMWGSLTPKERLDIRRRRGIVLNEQT